MGRKVGTKERRGMKVLIFEQGLRHGEHHFCVGGLVHVRRTNPDPPFGVDWECEIIGECDKTCLRPPDEGSRYPGSLVAWIEPSPEFKRLLISRLKEERLRRNSS
jgi:hypothetical protein